MSAFEAIDSESDADNELKLLKSMNPKQQLALTIKNWSDLVQISWEYFVLPNIILSLFSRKTIKT
jgi:hypothetical protein